MIQEKMSVVICRNCGAKIDSNDTECPYCHAMQYDASEKKYMNDLYKMNGKMDHLDNEALSFIRKQALRYGLIALMVMVLSIGAGAVWGYKRYQTYHNSASEQKKISASFKWYDDNIDTLNRYVSEEKYDSAAEIIQDYTGTYELLQGWEHYGMIYLYMNDYYYFDMLLQDIAAGEDIDKYTFYEGFDSAMDYLNSVTNKKDYAYTRYSTASEQDQEVMDAWSKIIDTFFTESVGVTQAEYMADLKQLYADGYCDYEYADRLEEDYYQRYLANH